MLAPWWSTALSTSRASRPSALEARFKRSEAMISQWHTAACRSKKHTFSLREAKLRAQDRRTAAARGTAEYSISSPGEMLSFRLPHTIRSSTKCNVVKTQHKISNKSQKSPYIGEMYKNLAKCLPQFSCLVYIILFSNSL